MYLPALFHEARTPVLHDLIRAHPLAVLVTLDTRGLVANHIPMEIDAAAGEFGTLRGHVARANPVWKSHRPEVEAMAVFQGPHSYITPSYYPTKQETGKVVPTWNYATVHGYGPLRVIEDVAWLRQLVERLTDRHEAQRPRAASEVPWKVSDAPESFLDNMLLAIVGIEIPISRLEGKWKVSQNRPPEDRAGVAAGLDTGGDPMRQAMAELVRARG
ncbi:MAG TPA: FMN-binding negative transcriptional regulator [Kofleriaceae bacterium]|jgi:transcriptional regulator|nr:FMN-binding negative transcriptional regulator [Kofleriaceae bacterium]